MTAPKLRNEIPIVNVMVKDVHCLADKMSVREAIRFLLQHKISGAPLVDEGGKVLSVVSEGDLLRLTSLGPLDRPLKECLERLCERSKLVTLNDQNTFSDAYRIFLASRIHRILILDKSGALAGLLSRTTVLSLLNSATPSEPKSPDSEAKPESRGKIVLAEDSAPNRRIIAHVLAKMGFEVIECCNGEEAWKTLSGSQESGVVAIVSDLMMPKMSGLELLKEVRASKEFAGLPFIIVSAIMEKSTVAQAVEHQINGYLLKPLSTDRIQKTVSSLLANRALRAV